MSLLHNDNDRYATCSTCNITVPLHYNWCEVFCNMIAFSWEVMALMLPDHDNLFFKSIYLYCFNFIPVYIMFSVFCAQRYMNLFTIIGQSMKCILHGMSCIIEQR